MIPKNQVSPVIMIVAGEASGDLHGAGLVKAMHEAEADLRFFGMGGEELKRAGVEIVCDAGKIAVMGFVEIFAALGDIISTFRLLKNELRKRKPRLLVLIDFADFNLRLAKEAVKLGIPVFYYITPKVWVWRKHRVKKLVKYVDTAGVIFPFEEDYLRRRGVNATYVGNPVLDAVQVSIDRMEFCKKYDIDTNKALVGLLPGSRRKEVAGLLPVFLESARRMKKKYSREIAFLIPLASTLTLEDLEKNGLETYRSELEIHILTEDRYESMAACDAVVAASGTVTLELAVLDVPMIVAYKFAPVTYFIGKYLVDIPYFSLVNIIAGRGVVTELLQDQVTPGTIEIELARILFDENVRKYMKIDLRKIRNSLGGRGASQKAARLALNTMADS
jgi:lipid-A-disaccharide synthase